MFPWVAKLAGNKQCFAATVAKQGNIACNDKLISEEVWGRIYIFPFPGLHTLHVHVNMAFHLLRRRHGESSKNIAASCIVIACLDNEGEDTEKKKFR